MFADTDLLPISALQHLVFCQRQWALIHLEGIWEENSLTIEGNILHERADTTATEARGSLRIARGLRLRSLHLGIVGVADVVEFHKIGESQSPQAGIKLESTSNLWRPKPVEYKRGKSKSDLSDEVQLCAQTLCLEEMLGVSIPRGAIYYGKLQKRLEIDFGDALREQTLCYIKSLHTLTHQGKTPKVKYEKKCHNCSLIEHCMPKITGDQRSAHNYFSSALAEVMQH